jgi:anionic cell wall polymer biosynthesis LytR-Cps2A-Psr (LCP) family protein
LYGFDYPEGSITTRGERALRFVRERHQLPRGDLDRAENQRNVTKAIVLSAALREDSLDSFPEKNP